ncbi:hypothetical protein ACS0TY_012348 [Phlomoides rotata]
MDPVNMPTTRVHWIRASNVNLPPKNIGAELVESQVLISSRRFVFVAADSFRFLSSCSKRFAATFISSGYC